MGRLPLPYHDQIGHRLRPGELIMINGFLPVDVERFTVNFMVGDQIAMHFDVRFNEDVIVRNSLIDGDWGDEEREGNFPFSRNSYFDMAVLVKENKFKMSVNGKGAFSYDHRLDVNDVDHLNITSEGAEVFVSNILFKMPVNDGVQTTVNICGHSKLPKKYAKFASAYMSQSSSEDSD